VRNGNHVALTTARHLLNVARSTVTRSSFNDERDVAAFRPISEAARKAISCSRKQHFVRYEGGLTLATVCGVAAAAEAVADWCAL